jgi:hypothetical protein
MTTPKQLEWNRLQAAVEKESDEWRDEQDRSEFFEGEAQSLAILVDALRARIAALEEQLAESSV